MKQYGNNLLSVVLPAFQSVFSRKLGASLADEYIVIIYVVRICANGKTIRLMNLFGYIDLTMKYSVLSTTYHHTLRFYISNRTSGIV